MRLPNLDLFPAPYSEPDTSREAAHEIAPALSRLRALVLDAIRQAGPRGACTHELEALLDLSGDTVRPRVWELRRAGLVEDSGLRRPTPSGRSAKAWRASHAIDSTQERLL